MSHSARVACPRARAAHEAQDEERRFLGRFRGKRSERFVYLANEDPLLCCVHEYGAPQAVAFSGEALWVFAVGVRCGCSLWDARSTQKAYSTVPHPGRRSGGLCQRVLLKMAEGLGALGAPWGRIGAPWGRLGAPWGRIGSGVSRHRG